jgi:hypothetical protein
VDLRQDGAEILEQPIEMHGGAERAEVCFQLAGELRRCARKVAAFPEQVRNPVHPAAAFPGSPTPVASPDRSRVDPTAASPSATAAPRTDNLITDSIPATPTDA